MTDTHWQTKVTLHEHLFELVIEVSQKKCSDAET